MTNVVDFPQPASPAGRGTEERAERAEALRRRVTERPKLTAADSEQLARNLFLLLARLEKERNLSRADLCRAVFNSSREESTKRLRPFALDPRKEGRARDRALNALAKKATNYLKLAEQAAKMVGDDPDAAILDLVHGTTLVQDASVQAADPLTRDLRAPVFRALERMADAVARRTDLHRTFRLMARYPTRERDGWDCGSPDLADDATAVPAGPVNEVPPILEDGASTPVSAELSPDWTRLVLGAPAVLVGESVLDETSEELMPDALSLRRPDDETSAPRSGEKWSATIVSRLQVWLGILPFGEAQEPRPTLRLELFKDVTLHREVPPLDWQSIAPLQQSEGVPAESIEKSNRLFQSLQARSDLPQPRVDFGSPGRSRFGECLELKLGRFDARFGRSFRFVPTRSIVERLDAKIPSMRNLINRSINGRYIPVAQIVALNSDVSATVLGFDDCGSISDWVGPLPNVRQFSSSCIPDLGHRMDDVQGRDLQEEHEACERDRQYRFRFRNYYDMATDERHIQGWRAGTLGYKLERSLLEIEGKDSIESQLEAQARALTERVQRDVGEALRRREERLSRLGRGET
jgi:hypothetical protein